MLMLLAADDAAAADADVPMLMLLLLIQTYADASFVAGCSKHAGEGEGTWEKQRQDKSGKSPY